MYDRKSDYALNKQNRNAIVCGSVTGVHIRLTCSDFSSEEEFQKWKAWSDWDYHTTEKAGRAYHDNRLPLADWAVPSAPSAEELLLEADGADAARAALIEQIVNGLTEKQFRRLRLYYLEGLSEREIARAEGVGQQRISRSILTGKKALGRIFLEIFGNRG